ncbi:MAG: hypothetical protein LBT46_14665, partial [Planctomycetaceae bacterium]|nr:hypothetical protein [Planctomycetaceae bacterium]
MTLKKWQIILSTHSAYVLEELPMEGRIMLFQSSEKKEVFYHVSAKFALSSMDEKGHPECFIYVEDEESERFVWEIIKRSKRASELMTRIAVKPIGSCRVVDAIGNLLSQGKRRCFLNFEKFRGIHHTPAKIFRNDRQKDLGFYLFMEKNNA